MLKTPLLAIIHVQQNNFREDYWVIFSEERLLRTNAQCHGFINQIREGL